MATGFLYGHRISVLNKLILARKLYDLYNCMRYYQVNTFMALTNECNPDVEVTNCDFKNDCLRFLPFLFIPALT